MLKTIASIASALLFGVSLAHAQAPAKIDLLTENFPPYNMAADGRTSPAMKTSAVSRWTSCARCSSAPGSITR